MKDPEDIFFGELDNWITEKTQPRFPKTVKPKLELIEEPLPDIDEEMETAGRLLTAYFQRINRSIGGNYIIYYGEVFTPTLYGEEMIDNPKSAMKAVQKPRFADRSKWPMPFEPLALSTHSTPLGPLKRAEISPNEPLQVSMEVIPTSYDPVSHRQIKKPQLRGEISFWGKLTREQIDKLNQDAPQKTVTPTLHGKPAVIMPFRAKLSGSVENQAEFTKRLSIATPSITTYTREHFHQIPEEEVEEELPANVIPFPTNPIFAKRRRLLGEKDVA